MPFSNAAAALQAVDQVELEPKAKYLGKSGELTEQLKLLGKLPPEEKRTVGAIINQAKATV